VWLAVHADRDSQPGPNGATILRIDPVTGEIQAEFATGGSMFEGGIYASDEAVWVRALAPFLAHIDPQTNEIVETIESNQAGGSVTVAYGSVWATSLEFGKVWRLTP